jgi:tetratricopeptide (TPR) repeat protein
MSEHELWNELGNLYFISGAYEPAIHAYARSIELDRGFGRPYSNMALAFVHTGRYLDAIELYHRSIELLSDAREKAITWNRLGILYRQVKDYQSALVAYEQADKLDSRQDERREEASRDVKYPLSITMPAFDLNAILERPQEPDVFEEVNGQLATVETELDIDWFDGDFVPPNPMEEPVAEIGEQETELIQEVTLSMEEEGWIPLVFEDAIAVNTPFEIAMNQQAEESTNTARWGSIIEEAHQEEPVRDAPALELTVLEEQTPAADHENLWIETGEYEARNGMLIHENELKVEEPANEFPAENNQWAEMTGYEIISELIAGQDAGNTETIEAPSSELVVEQSFENVSMSINDFRTDEEPNPHPVEAVGESRETELPFELQSVDANEDLLDGESNVHSTHAETPVEYSQVEYPLVELTPAEIDMIHIDIARFKRIIQINPRNAFAYDTLGGLYKSLGNFKDAIASYQKAISLDSTKPSYFYQLGLMYSAEKRDQEAMDAFQRVLSMDPGHILANASLGNYYRKLGLNDIAQQHIDIALQNVYEEENEYNQACLEAICGNTDRALELLQVAIEDNPSYINWAQHDPDLDLLRQDQRFYMLVQSYAQNK